MKAIPITLMLLALFMPIALAQTDWQAVCVNDVLVETVTVKIDGDIIPIERNISCSYGCDSGRRQCIDYSGEPGAAVPLLLFLPLMFVAWGVLAWSFLVSEILNKIIAGIFAAILLFPIGLLSLNVLVDGVAMTFTWLAWLNFVLGFLGVVLVIYGMILSFKEDLT